MDDQEQIELEQLADETIQAHRDRAQPEQE